MRTQAIDPDLIDLCYGRPEHDLLCRFVGQNIEEINAELNLCLQACRGCFHPWQLHPVQVFAAPFADRFGIDGLCNIQTQPITILVDVGRVELQDWLALVVHEYAHAQIGSPGHDAAFVQTLVHLCNGLNLQLPASSSTLDWRSLPPYRRRANSLAFWTTERR
jgi:hypothetical protein